jgi:hypothetical protein
MSISRVFAPLCAALLGFVSAASANPLDAIHEDDREALEALAVYPEDVRGHALEVATEPGVLVELQDLQDDSQKTFRDLLDPYAQSDQEQLFELSRYPDLVEQIARGGPKSRGELERIAARYPEDVRGAALRQGGARHRVIVRMNALLDDFDDDFDDLVADLPPRKAQAFRALLGTPEVLSLMTEHRELTVLLGDAYDRSPQDARERFADLNLEVARRNAEEAQDWKEAVDTDPELRRDYEAAARDYEADTGYGAYSPPRTSVNVVINPYPYWVGYPWWYPVSYVYYDPWYWWYPRPYWGHVGWRWGPRFYVGFGAGPVWRPWYPTPYFTSWYFSFGHHHHRYPYLSSHYVDYYWDRHDHHDRYRSNVHIENHYHFNKRVVKKFVYETDRVVSRDFLRGSREERVKRFREYGRMAPELEKVQLEARRKELGGRGRADRLRVPDRVRDADREASHRAAGEILRKREKDAPELARFAREPRAGDADRGRAERDRARDAAGTEKGARERGRDAAPSEAGARERGRDAAETRERGRDAAPSGTGARERGRDAAETRERGRDAAGAEKGAGEPRRPRDAAGGETGERAGSDRRRDGGDAGKGAASGRATPTFERPGGDAGSARDSARRGTREREAAPSTREGARSGERSGASRSERRVEPEGGDRGEPRAREQRAAPPFERDRSRAESREREQRTTPRYEPEARRRSSTPSVEREARPQSQPEARRQQPRSEPRRQVEPQRSEPRRQVEPQRSEPRRQVEPQRSEPRVERERSGSRGSYEAPRAQPRAEPRASSGGGRHGGGGGGNGGGGDGKRGKKSAEEEEQGGGGGGGRRR